MMIQLGGIAKNLNSIQVYSPTVDKSERDIQAFYAAIKQLKSYSKSGEITLVLFDFNAKVGKGRSEDIVGEYGLGDRNDREPILSGRKSVHI